MPSINAMVPPPRSSTRATSAHPPVKHVPFAEWKARRQPKPSIWARLNPFKSASTAPEPE